MGGGVVDRLQVGPPTQPAGGRDHDEGRWFDFLLGVFVEAAVADPEPAPLTGRVAVQVPEAVFLLTTEHALGGVQSRITEGRPEIIPLARDGDEEAVAAQQAEVFQRRRAGDAQVAVAQEHRGQLVDRLKRRQPAQAALHTARRRRPGLMLMLPIVITRYCQQRARALRLWTRC